MPVGRENAAERPTRVLILAPLGRDADVLCRALSGAGVECVGCADASSLVSGIREGAGALLLTEEALTPPAVSAVEEVLRSQAPWSELPLIILASGARLTPDGSEGIAALRRAGNVILVERPASALALLTTVQSALRARLRQYEERDLAGREHAARLRAEEAMREAERANRVKDEFLATVSHELRTPLSAILLWAKMLGNGRMEDADRGPAVEAIRRAAGSQKQLIDDLLDMNRMVSGKLRLEIRDTDLARVVAEGLDAVRPVAGEKGVALDRRGVDGPCPVRADPDRLQQVVWNLLNNAVKFTPAGGRVDVTLGRTDGSAVAIQVRDTGRGIASEFLPHVFDRFRQADASMTRRHGGLGLGLSLVRELVELHGGSVRAESAGPDRGSRFTVALPAAAGEGARRQTGDLEPAAGEPCAERDCNVLLVEDAPDTLEMLKVAFESRGYTVAACATPEEALRVAESGRFDIIVSDIGLPRIDGYELIARLRGLPHLRETPALALTGYAAQRDAEAALAAGFGAHVPKPVDPAELAERMDQLTRRGPEEKLE
jgi:signal transduction histidine kinase/ActR/RegA family two-component response regulator